MEDLFGVTCENEDDLMAVLEEGIMTYCTRLRQKRSRSRYEIVFALLVISLLASCCTALQQICFASVVTLDQ